MTLKPESKRIKNLKKSIVKIIPRSPNNKQSLQVLESKTLPDLLIVYANWAIRYITPRPRDITICPMAQNDERWISYSDNISSFLEKVKIGEDLTPNLSLQPQKIGFSPTSSGAGLDIDQWADKDMILNVMGYHHFHLGRKQEDKDHVERTDDVLFAKVTRNKFEVIAIFDHSVFETNRQPTETISAERKRLWEIYSKHSGSGMPPEGIALSGHSLHIVHRVQDYVKVIEEIDPKLDNKTFIQKLFKASGIDVPKKTKLIWHFRFLDLGVLDKKSGAYFVFRYGVN